MTRTLWYKQPASEWNHALAIGNGRLGGMVFGTVATERIQLNEDSLWYGGPHSRLNPDAASNLAKVRELLFAGQISAAEDLAMTALVGVPEHPAHYVPVGDLMIEFEDHGAMGRRGKFADSSLPIAVSEYRRELDISRAISRVSYRLNGTVFTREILASEPDQVIAIRLGASRPGALSCKIHFARERYGGHLSHPDDQTILMESSGGGEGSVSFAAMARGIAQGGRLQALGEWLVVDGADSLTILVSVATTFRHPDPRVPCTLQLDAAGRLSWDELKNRHVASHQRLFDRLDLSLGGTGVDEERREVEHLPTDERLARMVAGAPDRGLVELYFQFGRYLLIASSRPGTLPANLQGIWNNHFQPPWGSKYTININTQMNYWPAERANLGECHLPLIDHLERMLPQGRAMARGMYGCRGFVAHHNTDIWGDCAPVDSWIPASIWPMGAAWLCLHLWEHWEYCGDRAFLVRAYQLMREAALFHLDFLQESPDGQLVTNPSVSPENTYILPSGERGCMCFGPAMDSQILHELFAACAAASQILEVDADLAAQFMAACGRLPPPAIGRHGQLLEWPKDYDEAEPGHRHVSQLFALYPADQITVADTPQLAKACRVTLERRLSMGGGHTGWSKAWIINLWARLRDGELAWSNLEDILRKSTLPNLFDNHPPFQIDGNFGSTAGLIEMLVQCLRGTIHLLPALPAAIDSGSIRGVRAKGGFELDLSWKAGRLEQLSLRSDLGRPCRLSYAHGLVVQTAAGEIVPAQALAGGVVEFATQAGTSYLIKPGKPA